MRYSGKYENRMLQECKIYKKVERITIEKRTGSNGSTKCLNPAGPKWSWWRG